MVTLKPYRKPNPRTFTSDHEKPRDLSSCKHVLHQTTALHKIQNDEIIMTHRKWVICITLKSAENHEYSKIWKSSNTDHILVHNWSAQKSKRLIFKKWSIADDHVTDLMVDFRLIIYEEHLRVRLLSILMIQKNHFNVEWNIIAKINCKEISKLLGKNDFYWEYGNF